MELVLGLLGRLSAARPVLLILEDLHWADQSTLELVAFLIRALRGMRVLLAATYRSDELHRRHPLRPLLSGWERIRTVDRHRAGPVQRDEVATQLAAILAAEPGPGWWTWSTTGPAATPTWWRSSPGWSAGAATRRTCRPRWLTSC